MASPRNFETLGIPILKGRAFTPADKEGAPQWETIVGVVGEVHIEGQTEKVGPQIFFPAAQTSLYPVHAADLAIRTADAPRSIVDTLEEVGSASVAQRRFQALLLLLFAGAAVILSVVGVYGVVSYAAVERTPEIGLRLALGAQQQNILGLMLAHALRPILAGLTLGLAGALAESRLLISLLYEVKPFDPATFALAVILLGAVALGACLIPARRASRVDPLVALHCE